jgi:hypothetical protein
MDVHSLGAQRCADVRHMFETIIIDQACKC